MRCGSGSFRIVARLFRLVLDYITLVPLAENLRTGKPESLIVNVLLPQALLFVMTFIPCF